MTLAYTCSKCSNGEGIAFAVVTLLLVLAAVVAVFWHLVSKTHDKQDTHFKRLTHALPMQGLKTVLVTWQILTQVRELIGSSSRRHMILLLPYEISLGGPFVLLCRALFLFCSFGMSRPSYSRCCMPKGAARLS